MRFDCEGFFRKPGGIDRHDDGLPRQQLRRIKLIDRKSPDLLQVVGGPYDILIGLPGHHQDRRGDSQGLEQIGDRAGLAVDGVRGVQADQLALPRFVGQDTPDGQPAHATRQVPPVASGVRAEGDAAMTPLGRPGTTLTGAAGVLLNPRLPAAARDLGPGLGVVSAVPFVALVDDHGLMHQRRVHRHAKNSVVELDALHGLPGLVLHCDLHSY